MRVINWLDLKLDETELQNLSLALSAVVASRKLRQLLVQRAYWSNTPGSSAQSGRFELTRRSHLSLMVCVLLALAVAGCQGLPWAAQTPLPGQTQPAQTATPALTSAPQDLATPPYPAPASGPVTLNIWLPPQWDPAVASSTGKLLNERLRAFEARNPDVRILVRLKALEGSGGLLESLAAASAAAPLALPDLIALPYSQLESAALKSLLYPFDGQVMVDSVWYEYARQLAQVHDSTFGLPFAGDLLLTAYRPAAIEAPPHDWESALKLGSALAFPAADPQAKFLLAQYQAAGGVIQDSQGRPYLDEAVLKRVLTFYQQASQAGVMPFWLTQYETEEHVWQAFADQQVAMAAVWSSSYLSQAEGLSFASAFAPLPTSDGTPYTLASGWAWALASPDPARRLLAAQLAEFLVDPQFLAALTSVAGYFPPRSDALSGWGEAALRPLVDQISLSARLLPPDDVLASLAPVLEEAGVQVLKQQTDAQSAAHAAASQINQP